MGGANAPNLNLATQAESLPWGVRHVHYKVESLDGVVSSGDYSKPVRAVAYLGRWVAAIVSTLAALITGIVYSFFSCCSDSALVHEVNAFKCARYSFVRIPVIGELRLLISYFRSQPPQRPILDR